MGKVKLQKRPREGWRADESFEVQWNSCLPFLINPRAVLAHRPRTVATHFWAGHTTHTSCQSWCGMLNTSIPVDAFSADTAGRILCERCELVAVAKGLPPADTLVGKHVCKGGVRAFRTCCDDEQN